MRTPQNPDTRHTPIDFSIRANSSYPMFHPDVFSDGVPADADSTEVHGRLSGFVCANLDWEAAVDEELEDLIPEAQVRQIRDLLYQVRDHLHSDNMDFAPLVADDEEPMEVRLESLRRWCEAFTEGFGLGFRGIELSGEQEEILADFMRFADMDTEVDDPDAREYDFTEVLEYTRVAAMALYGAPEVSSWHEDDA